MKKKLMGIIIAGVIASQAVAVYAEGFEGMMPQNLVFMSDVSSGILAVAPDTAGYGNTSGGMTGTTGGAGYGGTTGTTGGAGYGGTTGTTGGAGYGGTTGTTGGVGGTTGGTGYGGATGTTGGAGGTTGTTGGGGTTGGAGYGGTTGTPGANTGGYTGNPNNYNPNAVGNMNETYQNTNQTGGSFENYPSGAGRSRNASGFSTIIPEGLNNKSQDANSLFNLNSDTYIVRDGDSLWLVMGQIKAKLEVLIYVDPENTTGSIEQMDAGVDKNNLSNTNNNQGLSIYNVNPNANTNTNANINNTDKNAIDNNYYGIPIYK